MSNPRGINGYSQVPIEDRFWSRVDRDGALWNGTPCWVWVAEKDRYGYGRLRVDGKRISAHRLAYELLVGLIPLDLEIDHKCRNPVCVNPSHLEPVTHRENVHRGQVGRYWANKTHCPQGHPYAGENLYVSPKGARSCRKCRHIRREGLAFAGPSFVSPLTLCVAYAIIHSV